MPIRMSGGVNYPPSISARDGGYHRFYATHEYCMRDVVVIWRPSYRFAQRQFSVSRSKTLPHPCGKQMFTTEIGRISVSSAITRLYNTPRVSDPCPHNQIWMRSPYFRCHRVETRVEKFGFTGSYSTPNQDPVRSHLWDVGARKLVEASPFYL